MSNFTIVTPNTFQRAARLIAAGYRHANGALVKEDGESIKSACKPYDRMVVLTKRQGNDRMKLEVMDVSWS